MQGLFHRFSESSTGVKIATLAVLTVWSVVLLALIVGGILLLPGRGEALPPGTPVAMVPSISLEPSAGEPGTDVMVRGEGWNPGSVVLIYAAAPGQTELPNYAIAGATADDVGRFTTRFVVPVDPGWENGGLATVTARTVEGASAQAALAVSGTAGGTVEPGQPTEAPGEPTATSTPVVVAPTETASPTVEPTSEAPTATPQPGQPLAAATTNLNVRGGPGTAYPVLGVLLSGQSAEITGVSPDGGWWQIRFAGTSDERGWVSGNYVTVQNTGNVPVVQPPAAPPTATPKPTVPPVVINDWRGEYYANPNLSGNPALVRNDVTIGFDWGSGAPAGGLPVDGFSARWTRSLHFPSGTYRFYVRADDGARLWIDGRLLIDQWHDGSPTLYSADMTLSEGSHSIRMEYYERSGGAVAQLAWERLENYPDWKGEYYSNRRLEGSPVLVRNDDSIDFDWDNGSPGSGVPSDDFSVRWTRRMNFSAGTYRFYARVDDGVRVWVDDKRIIDEWRDGSTATYQGDVTLSEGSHNVKMEYFERSGGAVAQLAWERLDSYPDWKGEYFDNRHLDDDPVLVRNDGSIDFDWGSGSPGSGVPSDDFSVRWTRRIDLRGGTYLFSVRVDDGVRLWVDDTLVIDSWEDGSSRLIEKEHRISDGTHRIKVEYYENESDAEIEVDWQRQEQTNQRPQAEAGGPYRVNEGGTITLDGRGSRDFDGRIVKYEWDFDYDGEHFLPDAEGETVSTSYPDGPASRRIALRVIDNRDARHLEEERVQVENVKPTANAGGPYKAKVGEPITLTGTASDPSGPDERNLVFTWDLGDGTRGEGANVRHRYEQPGTYTVRLVVADKDGAQDAAQTTVEVTRAQQRPNAVINGPERGLVGEQLAFSANGSTDPDGRIVEYAWDFGDGMRGSGAEVTHTYEARGRYQVSLVVIDNDGLRNGTGQEVRIQAPPPPNQAPVAAISGPNQGQVGERVAFSAAGSGDVDGQIVEYVWEFGDGATGNGVEVRHNYGAPGDYQVMLRVTDDGGLIGKAAHAITINRAAPGNQRPTAVIGAPARAVVNQPVQFDASGSSDPDGQIVRYVWDFGDGTTERGVTLTHVYTQTGAFHVKLTVVDNADVRNSVQQVIRVRKSGEAPPSTNQAE